MMYMLFFYWLEWSMLNKKCPPGGRHSTIILNIEKHGDFTEAFHF